MKNKIKVGDYVKSFYDSRWIGLVVAINPSRAKDQYILSVKQLIDRNGKLIPNNLQKVVKYNMCLFEIVDKPIILEKIDVINS